MANRKDGTPILQGDSDYQPVTPDKPAPGGQRDHSGPGIGQAIGDLIRNVTNATTINKALTKK